MILNYCENLNKKREMEQMGENANMNSNIDQIKNKYKTFLA